ncbi:MAG: hypothetical protein KAV82_16805, partial [Phycisphaerae bacterium]|nr:hypothetical protein [Phycisphaerae bacterium]
NHAELFGVQPGELIPGSPLRGGRAVQPLMYDCETGEYKFMLFYYSQHKDQVPVYASELRLLVLNKPGYPLVQAASTLRDLGKFSVTGTTWAQRFDPAEKAHTGMSTFSKLEAVIWAGTAGLPADPVSAVTFIGEKGRPDLGPYEKWRFVCDARTGEILHRESLIIFEDVTGNVSGMVTEGPKSEQCADEVVTALPYAYVNITGGNSTYADENGNFTIANDGVTEVTVESPLRGLYFRVYNQAGSDELLTTSVTPPAAADFLHNSPNNSEHVRAQVNGYANANEVRDFALCYNPNYPVIHSQTNFTIRVNRTDSYCPGNAWYDGSSLNFCASGTSAVGDHPNTSFASVGHHEYGHHLIQCSGSGQGQYGEGMADSVAMLIADDPGLGYGFFWDQCNTPLRNADNTYQYPCTGDIHDCGQLLSGSIWSTRNELAVTYPEDYLDIISNLTINSILLHSGEEITPQITIDFLTLDDTDGDIYNGTPHAVEICAGFGDHNMDCPEITFDPIGFEYPDGRPEMATPGVATTFRVHVIAVSGTPVSGTGQLHYCLDQGSWVTQGMTETAPNEYEAVLPAAYCGSGFEWYVSAEAVAHG